MNKQSLPPTERKPLGYIGKHVVEAIEQLGASTTTMTKHMAFNDDVAIYLEAEQQGHEPVAVVIGFDDDGNAIVDHACEPVPTLEIGTPLFLEAACSIVRKPLSNEKISEVIREHMKARALFSPNEFARDIEAAHGIKEAA